MASQFPEQSPPPAKGGSSVVKILLIVLIVVLLMCAGVCGGCIYMGQQTLKLGAEMLSLIQDLQNAIAPAKASISANEEVKAKLGDELAFGPVTPAKVDKLEDLKKRSNLRFEMMVTGSKGHGTATGMASEVDGSWVISGLEVKTDDGTVIPVPITDAKPELQFNVPGEEEK